MIRIKMNGTLKALGVLMVVAVVVCGLVLPQSASAALPAPNWLPGQPILAGNQIIAMWLPVPGAVKYNVYLDGNKIFESPGNQYMGLAPEAGTRVEPMLTSETDSPACYTNAALINRVNKVH